MGQQTVAMANLGELTQSDLTSLSTGLSEENEQINDTEDIFKQLNDTNFEFIFNDLTNGNHSNGVEIKVILIYSFILKGIVWLSFNPFNDSLYVPSLPC